jgi:hypothetical protein
MDMKHNVDLNLGLHKTLVEPEKILQRADIVWSRMRLEPDEVLFVKVSLAAAPNAEAIADLIDKAFGARKEQVLVYVEGTLDLTKVTR